MNILPKGANNKFKYVSREKLKGKNYREFIVEMPLGFFGGRRDMPYRSGLD